MLLIWKLNHLWRCLIVQRGALVDKAKMGQGGALCDQSGGDIPCSTPHKPPGNALLLFTVCCFESSSDRTEPGLFSNSNISCGWMSFFLPLLSTTSSWNTQECMSTRQHLSIEEMGALTASFSSPWDLPTWAVARFLLYKLAYSNSYCIFFKTKTVLESDQ